MTGKEIQDKAMALMPGQSPPEVKIPILIIPTFNDFTLSACKIRKKTEKIESEKAETLLLFSVCIIFASQI